MTAAHYLNRFVEQTARLEHWLATAPDSFIGVWYGRSRDARAASNQETADLALRIAANALELLDGLSG